MEAPVIDAKALLRKAKSKVEQDKRDELFKTYHSTIDLLSKEGYSANQIKEFFDKNDVDLPLKALQKYIRDHITKKSKKEPKAEAKSGTETSDQEATGGTTGAADQANQTDSQSQATRERM